jgi:uncharacterized protein YndB with AHSA1/START domain
MTYEFRVNARMGKAVADVFDAVVNPQKLAGYFVTTAGGASAPLVKGTTVIWWGDVPVEVDEVIKDKRIVFRWSAGAAKAENPYQTRVEMAFEPLDDGGTMVTISEGAWNAGETGLKKSYLNCEGWTQMLCCMKAFLEHGINLREGYYRSEMRGEPARENNI